MCGIAGSFGTQRAPSVPDLGDRVRAMVSAINHRGPDDSGVLAERGVGLGHARLSIIDLSPAGHQPMEAGGGRLQVVFNGEIYNFQDLRAELESAGYAFRSQSDTEVILHGYDLWGKGVFARLRGMFAVALWDAKRDVLVLARDRIGKKPLYYAWHEGTLLFASEIKAILAWPGMQRQPNLQAIHHYLSLQYVPGPMSAFEGVRKLEQATWMEVDRSGAVRQETYWRLPAPTQARRRPLAELKEELVTHLDEAVRLRMISDVPVGAFLSGGVDSSAVVAMMARHSSGPVKTFCIGFDEAEYDERAYARMVAERYGTDHHEMVVRPQAVDVLPSIVWHYNEPFADPSALPTYYVSKIAREHVTVALNGDGGDESFLGYGRYKQCLQTEWISSIPRGLRRASAMLANAIPHRAERMRIPRVAKRWLSYASEMDSRRYAPSMLYFFDQDKANGYGDQLRPYLGESTLDLLEPFFRQSPSYVGGAAWADIHTYLPDDLLVKVDVASMAHGLEARSPLLDHQLMEWAATVSPAQKIAGGETKALLKSAMEPYLPHDVLYRPKMGFGVPIDRWFRHDLKEFAHDLLLGDQARRRGLVQPQYVQMLLQEHCDGVRYHHTRLWALLMMELWFRMWIDPASTPVAPSDPALVA